MEQWPREWIKAQPADDGMVYLPWPEHGFVRVTVLQESGHFGSSGFCCACDAPETRDADESVALALHREHLRSLAGLGSINELA